MVKIGDKIILNEIEKQFCKIIANQRYKNNRHKNINNAKRGNQSNFETDFEGICAEFAFCKLLNLYPDLTIYTRSSKKNQDNGDVTLVDGRTIDIKVTKYKTGKLIAVPWKKVSGDLFGLMVGQFPEYTFKGVMKQTELLKKTRLQDLGYGDTFVAYQNELEELNEQSQRSK